jgi:hypothetical protein
MALSLIGISLGWIPRVGWLGLAISAVAVAFAVRGISDRRTGPAGLGYDTAGNFIGCFALPWTVAFQIKHAGGGLDGLLLAWPVERLLVAAGAAVAVFWAAQIVARWKARPLFVAVAVAAALAFTAAGASAWTLADRSASQAAPQVAAEKPSPR